MVTNIRFIGSARFWLPGSRYGSAKIYGSTDPDPRGKISMLKKIRNDLDPDPFFSNADPGSRSASKLNGS